MEDNINLDDEEYTEKNILNVEEKKKLIKKLLLKFINRVHDRPLLLREAISFKNWKIKAGIKQEESNIATPKIKKIKKKIKKKKTIKKEKKEGEIDIKSICINNSNNNNLNQDIIEYISNRDITEEKKDGKKKIKKIIKKSSIKKKLLLDDESEKNSMETNLTNLTSPCLIINEKLDEIEKEIPILNNNNIKDTKSNLSNKKITKKKKIIKKKSKKIEDNKEFENITNKENKNEQNENKIKKIVKKKIKKIENELPLEQKDEENIQPVNTKIILTEPNNNINSIEEKIKNENEEKPKKKKRIKTAKIKKKENTNEKEKENTENKPTPEENELIINNNIIEEKKDFISKSSNEQYKIDSDIKNPDSKVQFSEGVSQKNLSSIDFYHNRGKDSYIDLRAIAKLEKIEFSEDSDEEEKIKKKKKKKKKKIRKEGEREYTQEEKSKIKIYKKAMHLLRKAIKSYKKRNNADEYEDRFKFWKNIVISSNHDIEYKKEINQHLINEPKQIDNDDELNNYNNKEQKIKNLNDLIETNNKTNNEIIQILKNTDDKQFNNLEIDIYDKILTENNKKISCYKLFCLYYNYRENNSFIKKVFLKKWNKMI